MRQHIYNNDVLVQPLSTCLDHSCLINQSRYHLKQQNIALRIFYNNKTLHWTSFYDMILLDGSVCSHSLSEIYEVFKYISLVLTWDGTVSPYSLLPTISNWYKRVPGSNFTVSCFPSRWKAQRPILWAWIKYIQHEEVVTSNIKCKVKLHIHSETLTVQQVNLGNG